MTSNPTPSSTVPSPPTSRLETTTTTYTTAELFNEYYRLFKAANMGSFASTVAAYYKTQPTVPFFDPAYQGTTYPAIKTGWNDAEYPDFDSSMNALNDAQVRLSNIITNPNFSSYLSKTYPYQSEAFFTVVFSLLYPGQVPIVDQGAALNCPGVASSFDITSYVANSFIDLFSDLFYVNGNTTTEQELLASNVYDSAANIRSAVMQQYFNIAQSSGQNGRVVPWNNMKDLASANYNDLPNYESLFGEENYISVDQNESVLSPAAYLTDLENVRQKYIRNLSSFSSPIQIDANGMMVIIESGQLMKRAINDDVWTQVPIMDANGQLLTSEPLVSVTTVTYYNVTYWIVAVQSGPSYFTDVTETNWKLNYYPDYLYDDLVQVVAASVMLPNDSSPAVQSPGLKYYLDGNGKIGFYFYYYGPNHTWTLYTGAITAENPTTFRQISCASTLSLDENGKFTNILLAAIDDSGNLYLWDQSNSLVNGDNQSLVMQKTGIRASMVTFSAPTTTEGGNFSILLVGADDGCIYQAKLEGTKITPPLSWQKLPLSNRFLAASNTSLPNPSSSIILTDDSGNFYQYKGANQLDPIGGSITVDSLFPKIDPSTPLVKNKLAIASDGTLLTFKNFQDVQYQNKSTGNTWKSISTVKNNPIWITAVGDYFYYMPYNASYAISYVDTTKNQITENVTWTGANNPYIDGVEVKMFAVPTLSSGHPFNVAFYLSNGQVWWTGSPQAGGGKVYGLIPSTTTFTSIQCAGPLPAINVANNPTLLAAIDYSGKLYMLEQVALAVKPSSDYITNPKAKFSELEAAKNIVVQSVTFSQIDGQWSIWIAGTDGGIYSANFRGTQPLLSELGECNKIGQSGDFVLVAANNSATTAEKAVMVVDQAGVTHEFSNGKWVPTQYAPVDFGINWNIDQQISPRSLPARRPDIFKIPLTVENTTTEIPKINIVVNAIETQLENFGISEPVESLSLASTSYPFSAPYNYNQTKINSALALLSTNMATVCKEANDPLTSLPLTWQNWSTMSVAMYSAILKTPASSEPELYARFGLTNTSNPITPQQFQQAAGISAQDLADIVYADLSDSEVNRGLNSLLYINQTGNTSLTIVEEKGEYAFQPDSTTNDQLFDKANRFARLANLIGVNYVDLNWALINLSLDVKNLQDLLTQENTYQYLAGIQGLVTEYNLASIEQAVALVGYIKYLGNNNGNTMLVNLFGSTVISNAAAWSQWDSTDQVNSVNAQIGSSIMNGLGLNQSELTQLVDYMISLTTNGYKGNNDGPATATNIDLTADNYAFLAGSYRGAYFCRLNHISVEFLCFLLKEKESIYLSSINGRFLGIYNAFGALKSFLDQLENTNITSADFQMMCNLGGSSDPNNDKYLPSANDVNNLITQIGSHVSPELLLTEENFASFINSNADIEPASALRMPLNANAEINDQAAYNDLSSNTMAYIDTAGVVLKTSVSTADAATIAKDGNFTYTGSSTLADVLTTMLETYQQKQFAMVNSVLQNVLSLTSEQASTVSEWGTLFTNNPNIVTSGGINALHVFYTDLAQNNTSLDDQTDYYAALARFAKMVTLLNLSQAEINQILKGFTDIVASKNGDIANFGISSVQLSQLIDLNKLVSSYSDSGNNMLASLIPDQNNSVTTLCLATGWDQNTVNLALETWGYIPKGETDYQTSDPITVVSGLRDLLDYSQQTGLSVQLMLNFNSQFKGSNSNSSLHDLALQIVNVVYAQNPNESPDAINNSLIIPLQESYRDVLVQSVLNTYQNSGIPTLESIQDTNSLSEYLLTDVEVTSKFQTSKIKEAIGAYQMFIYRVIMAMEPGISVDSTFVSKYWPWFKNYSVWGANREVFVNPENYLRPDLLPDSSEIYQDFINDIKQSKINDENITKAFTNYLKGFNDVALCNVVGSYSTEIVDNKCSVYLVGLSPNTGSYYYRRIDLQCNNDQTDYTPLSSTKWSKIDISIPASGNVKVVYSFDRLFIIWYEITPADVNAPTDTYTDANEKEITVKGYKLTIKYSYFTETGNWNSPSIVSELPLINNPEDSKTYTQNDFAAYTNEGATFTVLSQNSENAEASNIYINLKYTSSVFDSDAYNKGSEDAFPQQSMNFAASIMSDFSIEIGESFENLSMIHSSIPGVDIYGESVGTLENQVFQTINSQSQLGGDGSGVKKFNTVNNTQLTTNGKKENYYLVGYNQSQENQDLAPVLNLKPLCNLYSTTNTPTQMAFWFRIENFDRSKPIIRLSYINLFNFDEINCVCYLDANDSEVGFILGSHYYSATESFEDYGKQTFVIPAGFQLNTWYYVSYSFFIQQGNRNGSPTIEFRLGNATLGKLSVDGSGNATLDTFAKNTPLPPGQGWYGWTVATNQNWVWLGANVLSNSSKPNLVPYDSSLAIDFQCVQFYTPNTADYYDLVDDPGVPYYSNIDFLLPFTNYAGLQGFYIPNASNSPTTNLGIVKSNESEYLAMPAGSTTEWKYIRITSTVTPTFQSQLATGGVSNLLAAETQLTSESSFKALVPNTDPSKGPTAPMKYWPVDGYIDLGGFNAAYYWELFYHAPLLIAQSYQEAGDYPSAQTWFQYVFNPQNKLSAIDPTSTEYQYLTGDAYSAKDVYWNFIGLQTPFNTALATETFAASGAENLEEMGDQEITTAPGATGTVFQNYLQNEAIQKYYEDPFDPDAIAALRPKAYQENTVMAYVQNLISWGDSLYEQETRESIQEAYIFYEEAYDLLGQPPQSQGNFSDIQDNSKLTLESIIQQYASAAQPIEEFLVGLEGKISNIQLKPTPAITDYTPYNLIPGLYFGIPQNSQVESLWSTLNNRFYNLRNNLDISGNPMNLPLFQPLANPLAIMEGNANGTLYNALQNLYTTVAPNYRFYTQLGRAKEFAAQTAQFGQQLLSIMQQKDAEALAQLQVSQQGTILEMTLTVKQNQIDAAQHNVSSLVNSIKSAVLTKLYYTWLINYNKATIQQTSDKTQSLDLTDPNVTQSFNFSDAIRGNNLEIWANISDIFASSLQSLATFEHFVAAEGYIIPNIFGMANGGQSIGDALNVEAGAMASSAMATSFIAGTEKTEAGYDRRRDEWQFQLQQSENQLNQLQEQWNAANKQLAIAQQDYQITETQIKQNAAILNFYKTKFTNEDLYQWMKGQLIQLYYQSYKLSTQVAEEAQTAFEYEKGLEINSLNIVNANTWNSKYDGLMSTDPLIQSLNHLEKQYMDMDTRRMEITKTISLADLLGTDFTFQPDGSLSFTITEQSLDGDFPGQYCRLIKTLSVSIPTLLGPYQNVHATLLQASNAVVVQDNDSADATGALKTATPDATTALTPPAAPSGTAIRSIPSPCQTIAMSMGIDDTGLFTMSMDDPRYLPFEGTGAVSSWVLTINDLNPQIQKINGSKLNAADITDIIITLRYCALVGSSTFKTGVMNLYNTPSKSKSKSTKTST